MDLHADGDQPKLEGAGARGAMDGRGVEPARGAPPGIMALEDADREELGADEVGAQSAEDIMNAFNSRKAEAAAIKAAKAAANKAAANEAAAKAPPELPTVGSPAGSDAKAAAKAKKAALTAEPKAAPKKRGRPPKDATGAAEKPPTKVCRKADPSAMGSKAGAPRHNSLALSRPVVSLSFSRLEITADTDDRPRVCIVSMKHSCYNKAEKFAKAVRTKIESGKSTKDDVLTMRRQWKADGKL